MVRNGNEYRARGPNGAFRPEDVTGGRPLDHEGPAQHPVGGLRLERTRDGEHHSYLLLLGEVTLGSGPDDALSLPHDDMGVEPGHVRLGLREEGFTITALRADASVVVSGVGPLTPEVELPLEPGVTITLGSVELTFALAVDDDMKP